MLLNSHSNWATVKVTAAKLFLNSCCCILWKSERVKPNQTYYRLWPNDLEWAVQLFSSQNRTMNLWNCSFATFSTAVLSLCWTFIRSLWFCYFDYLMGDSPQMWAIFDVPASTAELFVVSSSRTKWKGCRMDTEVREVSEKNRLTQASTG